MRKLFLSINPTVRLIIWATLTGIVGVFCWRFGYDTVLAVAFVTVAYVAAEVVFQVPRLLAVVLLVVGQLVFVALMSWFLAVSLGSNIGFVVSAQLALTVSLLIATVALIAQSALFAINKLWVTLLFAFGILNFTSLTILGLWTVLPFVLCVAIGWVTACAFVVARSIKWRRRKSSALVVEQANLLLSSKAVGVAETFLKNENAEFTTVNGTLLVNAGSRILAVAPVSFPQKPVTQKTGKGEIDVVNGVPVGNIMVEVMDTVKDTLRDYRISGHKISVVVWDVSSKMALPSPGFQVMGLSSPSDRGDRMRELVVCDKRGFVKYVARLRKSEKMRVTNVYGKMMARLGRTKRAKKK